MNITIRQAAIVVVLSFIVAWGLSGVAIASEAPVNGTEVNPEPISAEEQKVNLSQDELIVESGETVTISGWNATTPTDFIVKEGGYLIIRDSYLFMEGKHHHDNYFEISGNLTIRNSTIESKFEMPPSLSTPSKENKVIITNSTFSGYPYFRSSGTYLIQNSKLMGASIHISPRKESNSYNLSMDNVTISYAGVGLNYQNYEEPITISGMSSAGEFLYTDKGNDIQVKNITHPQYTVIFRGDTKQQVLIKNSSNIWVKALPAINLTIKDSDLRKINPKLMPPHQTEYVFSNISPGYYEDQVLFNTDGIHIEMANSSVEMIPITAPGVSEINELSFSDSQLSTIKTATSGNYSNVSIGGLQLYKFENSSIIFDNTHINGLYAVISAEGRIEGNVTIGSKPEEFNVGGLTDLSLTREYPVNISACNSEEKIQVFITNPNGTEIENTSYTPDTEYVFPEVRYNLSNYHQIFTLTIRQGNRSETRPLTLTMDTPINVYLGTEKVRPEFRYKPATPHVGQTVSFNGTVTGTNTSITEYRWDLDSDGAYETTGKIVHHTFHSAGTYQVTLQVVTEHGLTNTTSRQLHVQQLAERVVVGPEGDFTTIDAAVQAVSPG
ncbi:MAG: PKD domain-containing protein, partial [Halobacteriaceae archaeon]